MDNIIFDGPSKAGKTSAVSLIANTVLGLGNMLKHEVSEEGDESLEKLVKNLEENKGFVVDGGILSEAVFRRRTTARTTAGFESFERRLDNTLLVLLYVDPRLLVERGAFSEKRRADVSMNDYLKEFMKSKMKHKLVLDTSHLPASICFRQVMWVLNKRVRR